MGIFRTDDPAADFDRWDAEQTAWLAKRPVCYECGEHIQDEDCCELNGELICTDCLEANHKKRTEDYIE